VARGVGRLRTARFEPGADVDVDATVEPLLSAASERRTPSLTELSSRVWTRRRKPLVLIVDRSGSMGGGRLAAAALAAAVVAARAPDEYAVISFGADAVVVKGMHEERPVESVIDDLLALRGHGPTDLALALGAARTQLALARSPRPTAILLSDGRPTAGADPVHAARALDSLLVVAPAGDAEDARSLARSCGARCVELAGPMSVPSTLAALFAP
jgi:Mg-chelatase subunit ChlD